MAEGQLQTLSQARDVWFHIRAVPATAEVGRQREAEARALYAKQVAELEAELKTYAPPNKTVQLRLDNLRRNSDTVQSVSGEDARELATLMMEGIDEEVRRISDLRARCQQSLPELQAEVARIQQAIREAGC